MHGNTVSKRNCVGDKVVLYKRPWLLYVTYRIRYHELQLLNFSPDVDSERGFSTEIKKTYMMPASVSSVI